MGLQKKLTVEVLNFMLFCSAFLPQGFLRGEGKASGPWINNISFLEAAVCSWQ